MELCSWVFSTFEYETEAMSYQSVGVSLRIRSTPRESKEWIFRVPIPYEKKLGMDRCNPEILGPTNGFLGCCHSTAGFSCIEFQLHEV